MPVITKIKLVFTGVAAVLSSLLGTLYIPVLLLVVCNVIDYATGLAATVINKDRVSSYKSIKGIAKKVGMWLLIVVGAIVDQLIKYSIKTLGFDIKIHFLIACIVAVWLVCNEVISILENIGCMGTHVPDFILPAINLIKGKIGSETLDKDMAEKRPESKEAETADDKDKKER